jgi:hypothetical protein
MVPYSDQEWIVSSIRARGRYAEVVSRCLARCGLWVCVACAPLPTDAESVGYSDLAVVYDEDDRRDYYEVQGTSERRLFKAHSVAFVRDYRVESLLDGTLSGIPTWQELEQLCPGEPFAAQPSAAFCSGVLVGDGLVLTSRHCFRDPEFAKSRVVFGYYLDTTEHLAVTERDIHEITSISLSSESGLDYAWVRFAGETTQGHFPVPVVWSSPPVVEGERLIAVSSGGGIPLKLDRGGMVIDTRPETQDYFITDLDAFRGGSGSGVFNTAGALVGIVKGGSGDFVRTESGCRETVRLANEEAKEQVLYVGRAIDGLCDAVPSQSLCGGSCYKDCYRPNPDPDNANVSCTVNTAVSPNASWVWAFEATMLVAAALRRKQRRILFAWAI